MANLKQLKQSKTKLKANIKQIDRFLNEVKKAKKDGIKKAKMNTKTYTINSLITQGNRLRKTAVSRLKRTEKEIKKKVEK